MRKGALAAVVFGVLLIAAGLVVKFAVTPALAKFPDDVDTDRSYVGNITVLNRDALEILDIPNLFYVDAPAKIDRNVTTVDATGDVALVRDYQLLDVADGSLFIDSEGFYTIDRKTMNHVVSGLANDMVDPNRDGLVIGWPIGTEPRDYAGWSDDPAIPVTVVYAGEEDRAGRTTYKFTARVEPSVIVDPGTLEEFPATLDRNILALAGPVLNLPAEAEAEILAMLGDLPEQVPIVYRYSTDVEYWVDPATGVLIDIERHDIRDAGFEGPNGYVYLTDVYDLTFATAPQSVEDAISDADEYGGLLTLGETIVPWGLVGLGAVLLLGGGLAMRRKRPAPEPAGGTEVQPADEVAEAEAQA